MRGVVFLGEGRLELRQFPDPTPGPDDVILRIKASGMCGSDLHHLHGPLRAPNQIVIEGHEPCGVVEQVGSAVPAAQAQVGDRVMVHHYDGCRTCRYCRSGWTQFCPNDRIVYGGLNGHGAHADLMKVPAHTLIKLPDALTFKAGAAVSCGSGTAFGAIKRVELSAEDTVAVFGQGPVGLSCTLFAKAFGARVIAVDVDASRLEMAKAFGADHAINSASEDAVRAIRALSRNREGADKSIECSGNDHARRHAIQSIRRLGSACLVGVTGKIEIDSDEVILYQKSVLGSLTFSKNLQEDCANFVAERGLNVDALFTHEFGLEQAKHAYELFDKRLIGKGVFVFD